MSIKSSNTRYGSVAIAIHWLTALLILALFVTGLMAEGQTDPAAQLALVRFHVPLGIAVLLLTVLRIVWWWAIDRRPELPAGQPDWQKFVAKGTHVALYLIVLLLAASGIATLVLSGAMPAIIAGTALPDFDTVLPRAVHGLASKLLLVVLALHIGAALYHQFIRRDHLLARMGLGA
jgi:cytochrome b561